jgi:raffinose/stachyose/melibiose transport system permease protein
MATHIHRNDTLLLLRVFLTVVLAVLVVVALFPLYYLLAFSLKSNIEIFQTNPMGIPRAWLWKNYIFALGTGNVGRYLLNSIIVTSGSIALTLASAMPAAYALIRMKWRLSRPAMVVFMSGFMIAPHAALLPVFLMLQRLHLTSTYFALIIPYTAFSISIAIYIYSGFLRTLPRELEESAYIDGSSSFRTFVAIIAPLLSAPTVAAAIQTYIFAWNDLLFANVFINKESLKTLTAGILSMVGYYATEWGPIGAGLTIATLPTLIIYMLISGRVQQSLMSGALKG